MANKNKKKKKSKFKKILTLFVILLCLFLIGFCLLHSHIKNIYVIGNNIVSDKEIIKLSKLNSSSQYVTTYFMNIEKKTMANKYIKNVTIERKPFSKIYIYVEEYKPICIYNKELILSSKSRVENTYNIDYVPYVIGNIDSIYDKFVEKFSLINEDVLVKISQIEYVPSEYDKERFLLYMVDANNVYITLSKIEKINKYNTIVSKLDNKKGIIYLDSGDYLEIKNN